MTDQGNEDFGVTGLRRREKPLPREDEVDRAAAAAGFAADRPAGRRTGGRRKSPRTAQIHAWVHPEVREEIASHAHFRDTQQGVLLEEAWLYYRKHHLRLPPLETEASGTLQ